jgi:hypothetical protein
MILLAFLAAAAAAPAAAPRPRPAALKTFADWTVGCDNGRLCHAVGLVPENAPDDAATMAVTRGPEAGAVPAIDFQPRDGDAVWVEADGKRLSVRLVQGGNGAQVAPAQVPTVLAALRSARRIKLLDRDGAALGTVSLAGASAALLYMDEGQQRTGTVTALVRPGARSASAVPAPPALPVVHAARPSGTPIALGPARIAALRKAHGCTIDEVGGPDEAEAFAIAPGRTLVLLACGSGAYNVSRAERRPGPGLARTL